MCTSVGAKCGRSGRFSSMSAMHSSICFVSFVQGPTNHTSGTVGCDFISGEKNGRSGAKEAPPPHVSPVYACSRILAEASRAWRVDIHASSAGLYRWGREGYEKKVGLAMLWCRCRFRFPMLFPFVCLVAFVNNYLLREGSVLSYTRTFDDAMLSRTLSGGNTLVLRVVMRCRELLFFLRKLDSFLFLPPLKSASNQRTR